MIVGANKPWQYMEGDILLPWYTLTCLEWLTKQDVSKWIVFEFGCGYSTIWWKLNSLRVFSVDSDKQWARAMNATFFLTKEDYVSYAKLCTSSMESIILGSFKKANGEENLFDCIVIDGAWRFECLQNSFDRVRQGGYIIIDNWGQEDFPHTKEAEELLVGWEKLLFKQPNHSKWITAVFRKP